MEGVQWIFLVFKWGTQFKSLCIILQGVWHENFLLIFTCFIFLKLGPHKWRAEKIDGGDHIFLCQEIPLRESRQDLFHEVQSAQHDIAPQQRSRHGKTSTLDFHNPLIAVGHAGGYEPRVLTKREHALNWCLQKDDRAVCHPFGTHGLSFTRLGHIGGYSTSE